MILSLDGVIALHERLVEATRSPCWPSIVDYLEWRERQEVEALLESSGVDDMLCKGRIQGFRALKGAGRAAAVALEGFRKRRKQDDDRRKEKADGNQRQEGAGQVAGSGER